MLVKTAVFGNDCVRERAAEYFPELEFVHPADEF